jgi:hypothetical protein
LTKRDDPELLSSKITAMSILLLFAPRFVD